MELKNLNVTLLESQELKDVNGGLGALAWFLLGVIVGELNDRNAPNDFKDGYNAYRQDYKN